MEKKKGFGGFIFTCKVPRLAFVDINLGYGVESERLSTDLPLQIVNDELFVGRVEPEARR